MHRSQSAPNVDDGERGERDSPSKQKKERGALHRLNKLSIFGRKHRKDSNNGGTATKEQLQEYLNNNNSNQETISRTEDELSSICDEESALILWEEDGNVKAATLVMLIRRITDEKFIDSNLLADVIASYRSFTTPTIFLDLLIQRFETSFPIALRVCAVLKAWIERQWADFDPILADTLTSFLKDTVQPKDILKNVAVQLLGIISKKQSPSTEGARSPSLSDPPKPLLPLQTGEMDDCDRGDLTVFESGVTLWSFPAKEIARQLTLVEHKRYQMIQSFELISQAWAKGKKAENVLSLITHFNKVSGWVCSEIINTSDLQLRIDRTVQLIDVAMHFFTMNNFNGLMAVLAGLHSSSVHRLKRTWAGMPEKVKEDFEFLTQFMSSAKNYSQYREHLQKAQLPVLPYLGVCLSDLTFIEEGNPDEISNLINFSKCRQIAAVIRKICEFQSVPYSLIPIPFIQNYFLDFVVISEKEAYEASTRLEPRALSTMVSASASPALVSLSSSLSSLGSSVGLDPKDFDLDPTYELVEGEVSIDTMHTRFRKDLIRERNNSLNVGEPFTVKVQLPGSVLVEMRMPDRTLSGQAVKHFANFFSGINEQYCLVVLPCKLDTRGYVFSNNEPVREVLKIREQKNTNTKLALFASPLVVTFALFSNSKLGDSKGVLVDVSVPLFSLFSLFQEILNITEEITFMAYNQSTKQTWWLNSHKGLEANQFSPNCLLVVFPISNLSHRNAESMGGGDKQGILLSGGREGTLKVATVRQLLAVLSGPFLLCYKNKNDASPLDIIVIDRYSVQCSSHKHVSVLLDKNPNYPPPQGSSSKSHFSFAGDMDSETRAWFRAFQRNRGLLGDKVVFGEDLDRIAKQQIPVVLQKTINFIHSHALQMEGIFKPHTNSSLVQHYKNQFDQGVEVEFTRTNDAGTVAQLLLLYFEELPDPLLPYELFPKFVDFFHKKAPEEDEVLLLRDIVSLLSHPHMSVLSYLLAFLSQVYTENPIKNGITHIYGPCLLRAPPLDGSPKGYKEMCRSILAKLIKHREKIFVGLSRRPESTIISPDDLKPPPCSNTPNNNNPHLKELSSLIDKQLQNAEAIAKRVELLKSQLENKYMDFAENKYKSANFKRQAFTNEGDNNDNNNGRMQMSSSSPIPGAKVYHRPSKSTSYPVRSFIDNNNNDPIRSTSFDNNDPLVLSSSSPDSPSLRQTHD